MTMKKNSPVRLVERAWSADALDLYFQDIGDYEVLTREKERELSRRIIGAGDEEAVEELVVHNLRFVVSYARSYYNNRPGCGLTISELISAAHEGLIKAARRFDVSKHDVRFVSYAIWWIRQAMLQISTELGNVMRIPQDCGGGELYRANKQTFSLEDVVSYDGRRDGKITLGEVVPDDTRLDEETRLIAMEEFSFLCRNIRGVLKAAGELGRGERRRRTSVLYYGLDGSFEGRTLDYIGLEFDVTREMIRQVKEDTWVRLRGCGLAFGEDEFVSKLQSLQILENLVGETANFLEGPVEYSWFNVTTPEIQGERLGKRRREQERIQAMIK